jgi:predicted nucleic acid-binding protein
VRGYLLDTNVASETRKGPRINANVSTWYESVEDEDMCLSVLVIGEIRKGIELARHKDPVKANALEGWLNALEQRFGDRVLPITSAVAEQWGRLSAIRPLPTVDGLLAATAMVHDLALATRNVADVAHTGVKLLNPFLSKHNSGGFVNY